jgi:hypothetical protein
MKPAIRNTLALCAYLGCAIGAVSAANAQTAPAAAEPAVTAPAGMAAAKPPHKAKPKANQKAVVVVTVSNKRTVALTELDASPVGGAESSKILSNLAPGKKANVQVAHDKDCTFDLHGAYEDGSTTDLPGMDLCKDAKINLVE